MELMVWVSLLRVTYPDGIDDVDGDAMHDNACIYLRNIGPLSLMLYCCRMPLHSLQSFVVIHSTKFKHIAYSGLSAMISALRAYQV